MSLDPWTSSVIAALLLSVLTIFSVLVPWQQRNYPGYRQWTAANALAATGMFIASVRPSTTNWTNVLFVLALILIIEGTRAFCGSRFPTWWIYAAAIIAALWAAYAEYVDDPNARNISIGLFHALAGIVCAAILFRNLHLDREFGSKICGAMFSLFAVINIVRVAYFTSIPTLAIEPNVADFFIPSPVSRAFYIVSTVAFVCCSFAWHIMLDERLLAEVKQQETAARLLAERAEAADLAKSEFITFLSHELRNPLSAILNVTDLMLDTKLGAEQRAYENGVRRSVEALLRVTEDALDLSRVESGHLAIQPTTFNPVELLDSVARMFQPLAREKGVDLIVDYGSRIPNRLIGDAGRIRQVLTNLVGNATKFTQRGQIRIISEYQTHSGTLRIAVVDTGIGISLDSLSTLFEKSSSAHAITASSYGGMGIGLTISKKLIELMGGQLAAESEVGRGSTFWFELALPSAARATSA